MYKRAIINKIAKKKSNKSPPCPATTTQRHRGQPLINLALAVLLTADLELAVLSRAQHWMGQAEPGQLLAELGHQVVGEEAHHPGQDVQDKTKSRLGGRRRTGQDQSKTAKTQHRTSLFHSHL